jgi:hypothetical protein
MSCAEVEGLRSVIWLCRGVTPLHGGGPLHPEIHRKISKLVSAGIIQLR